MKKPIIIIATLIGLMAFYACEKDDKEDEVVPQTQANTNNNSGNSGNNGGGNNGGNSTDQPSQSLRNHPLNTVKMVDTLTNVQTDYVFNYYSVLKLFGNNGDSAITVALKEDDSFFSGDIARLTFTNGSGNPFIPTANKNFNFRTHPTNTYPNQGEWQLRFCPEGGIADKNYDCYTQNQEGPPFYRILSKTKLFYERTGDKHTFMFENHLVDDKMFSAKFEITNAEISKASYDGTEEKGSL